MSRTVALTLYVKPGCHLCDDARAVVSEVREAVSARGIATELDEVNILDDAQLARLHAEDIPVLLVDGRRHAIWRVDPARLTTALERAARPRFFRR